MDPALLVMGGDARRLQWLTHHVTSRWPNAQVMTGPEDTEALLGSVADWNVDAVLFQIDFGADDAAEADMKRLSQLLRTRPALHCIILADNGTEIAAVRSMKAGAKEYLPLAGLSGAALLTAIAEACAQRRPAAPTAPAATTGLPPAAGIRVPGYWIVKEISTSNFSSVFLARSERLRSQVILKVMKRGESKRELDDAERFQREYEIISSVTHRAIAEIHDFGVLPDHLYLAMEYIPCGDLRDRMRNPLSIDESRYYLRSIAEALQVIHPAGILHRDLKPANVMLREDNSPVLIDFGLARRAAENSETTGAGQVLGSPFYISPEQARGQSVDQRTDLYSLGVMFHEMLTGRRPYSGNSAVALMAQHVRSPLPILPAPLAPQQALLDRLMAKRPEHRFASADELIAALGPAVAAVA